MSAPHSLDFDVLFNGNKIDSFNLDVDLDNPIEIFEEISKLFVGHRWFDAKILFRFSEHLYYANMRDFINDDTYYNNCHGELRLVLTHSIDYG